LRHPSLLVITATRVARVARQHIIDGEQAADTLERTPPDRFDCNGVSISISSLDPPEPQRMSQIHRQSLVAYGQPLCETVADCPSPRGGEVLVRIERCGVCHSDLHLQDGYFSLGADKKLDVSETAANCGGAAGSIVSFNENITRAGVNYKFGPW
jgi:hypothetical protein